MINKDINKISISSKDLSHDWHLVDANDQILGRVATDIAMKLMGKDKVGYAPNLATGDYVVVINSNGVNPCSSRLHLCLTVVNAGFVICKKLR